MAKNASPTAPSDSGVFPYVVNRKSFADKVIISVWSERRKVPLGDVVAKPTRPIGGPPGRIYARSMPLVFPATGNEGELKYGKLKPWGCIPDCQLVLRSVRKPLDRAEVKRALAALFVRKCQTSISQVEMTFDTAGASIRSLENSAFTRANKFLLLRDPVGSETLYIGGPRSKWQLRVYQKTPEIVRIEFILRRQKLRDQGIVTFEDVSLLRGLDTRRMASFLNLGKTELAKAMKFVPSGWQKTVNLNWVHRRPLQLLVQSLRRDERIDLGPLLSDSKVQLTIERMRLGFIW
jgi:hypothetical protein